MFKSSRPDQMKPWEAWEVIARSVIGGEKEAVLALEQIFLWIVLLNQSNNFINQLFSSF